MDRQCSSCGGFCKKSGCERENVKPKEWVGLTDEEVNDCIKSPNRNLFARDGTTSQRIARAIEAKLKEKNT